MPIDTSFIKLGKQEAVHDDRTLLFADYLTSLPKVPTTYNWGNRVADWPMMANDTLGDCTIAAAGHLIQEWTADSGSMVVIPDEKIISLYSAITGYVPGDDSTDQGAVCLDVLNYWRKTGMDGHKLYAFTALEPGNVLHVTTATYLFGGIYLGLQLPLFCKRQIRPGGTFSLVPGWDLTAAGKPGSWGGHAIPVVGFSPTGVDIITWGMKMRMSWHFFQAYVDEAYAPLSHDWAPGGILKAPAGFNLAELSADLKLI